MLVVAHKGLHGDIWGNPTFTGPGAGEHDCADPALQQQQQEEAVEEAWRRSSGGTVFLLDQGWDSS